MTILELYNLCFTIIDKYGEADISDAEFTRTWNLAQYSVVKDKIEGRVNPKRVNEPPTVSMGKTSEIMEDISILISQIDSLSTDVGGQVTVAAINVALSGTLYHMANCSRVNGTIYENCQFVRHNDRYRLDKNDFKKPTVLHPWILNYNTYFQVLPVGVASLHMALVRYPADVSYITGGRSMNPEFTDKVNIEVLFRALQLFGIVIRENDFYQIVNTEHEKE